MPEKRCSYKNCSNSRYRSKGIRMFRFSTSNSDEWITRAGNPDLIGLSPSSLKKKTLCEQHFRPQDILPSGRLMQGTLPIQYTRHEPSASTSHSSPSPKLNRSASSSNSYLSKSSIDNLSPAALPNSSPSIINNSSPQVVTPSATFSVEKVPASEWIFNASPQKSSLTKVKKCLFVSPMKEKILRRVELQSKNLAKKRARISKLTQQLAKTNEFAGKKFKSEEAAILFKMQNHKERQPWSAKEKRFSTALFLRSPSAYRYMHKLFVLPAENTIRKWLSTKKCFQTGFNKSLLEKIKIKAESMDSMEKACVLLFDEMAIKRCLEYSANYDLIEGYQDIGSLGREKKIAKEASVFMIRGLFYQWKLPIGYFVSDKGLLGTESKTIINDCINSLMDAGLNVCATVCDQSTTNVKAFKTLGISVEKPYFSTSRGHKVVALFDSPHLIKSLRNNLITHDFSLDGKTISFSDIRELYDIDRRSGSTRAAPQLTPAHIWPNSFQKMSVSLATQIFSHTTASALKTAHATGQLKSNTALDTAHFLSQINKLFDAMNSKTRFSRNPYACALSSNSIHVQEIFHQSKEIFMKLKKINSPNPRPPCFDGFLLNINAYSELLASQNCSYIITSRLNQDPLENLFSSIRQRGGWNRNPSVRVLRGTLRILTIEQLLEPPKTTSYDPDHDLLLDLGEQWEGGKSSNPATKSSESSSISSETEEEEEDREEKLVLTSDDFNVVNLEECSTVYFAGYVARMYLKRFNCEECYKKMINSESELKSKKELLIFNRSFSNIEVSEMSGLLSPSDRVLYVAEIAIKVFKKIFKKIAHKKNVVKRLILATTKVVSVDSVTCPKCGENGRFILQHLFKVLVHKQCKWISSEMKNTAQAKLRILQHV